MEGFCYHLEKQEEILNHQHNCGLKRTIGLESICCVASKVDGFYPGRREKDQYKFSLLDAEHCPLYGLTKEDCLKKVEKVRSVEDI